MAQAKSISLSQFTQVVQAAVKAAVQKHPKFLNIDLPQSASVSNLIMGFVIRENTVADLTVGETQAFAKEIAAHLSSNAPEASRALLVSAGQGAIYSSGGHVILGIPAAESLLVEK